MTYTYANMQAKIADELDRSDLTSQIKLAIQDAISHYERRYFWFLDTPGLFTFSTVRGQEYYTSSDAAAISTAADIITLTGTFYGLRRALHKRSWEFVNSISTFATSYAQPQDWAYAGQQIRLYPIPDAAYTLSAFAVPRLTRPSADTDTGVWMNEAEELIRTRAKVLLIRNTIRGSEMADELLMLQAQEREAYAALMGETANREGTGQLQPVSF